MALSGLTPVPFAVFILSLSLFFAGIGTASQSAAQSLSCRGIRHDRPHVTVDDPEPVYRHDKSIRTINRLRRSARRDFLIQGLTAFAWESDFELSWEGVPVGNDLFCLRPVSPVIRVTVTAHNVWLPTEFPADSCAFKAVKRHENKHVAVNRRHLELLRQRLVQGLEADFSRLRAAAPIAGARFERTADRWSRRLANTRTRIINQVERALNRAQANVDTPQEYERVNRSCGPQSLLQRDFR